MRTEDMILVSVDDHVVEPPDLFEGRLSAKAAERAPRMVKLPNGVDAWTFEGAYLPSVGLNAVAGRVPDEYGLEPVSFDQMRAGCWDIHERIRDMNVNGVLGSLNFPSLTGFCGQLFTTCPDPDISLELLQAYNDWHIDEWCGTYPGRMIPLAVPPIWDPQLMAAEVRRVKEKGCSAVSFSENPEKLGYPSFHTDHWDPFWQACVETDTVVCLHIGSSSTQVVTSSDAPFDTLITLTPLNIVQCAADLLWSPVLRKFDGLKVSLSEGGIGWIRYFLERVDYTYEKHHRWTGQDFGDKLPSQVFNEHVITCFIDDPVGVRLWDQLDWTRITWECDYPHSDCTWPTSPELAAKQLEGLPDHVINAITHENAMRLYNYDPFAHIPREQCTVGALRAQAADVDTTPRSYGKVERSGMVTARSLAERMTARDKGANG